MKNIYFILLLFWASSGFAQYYSTHYIAPAPWQYWNDANEIVIGTLEPAATVSVELRKSDGTLITTLNVTANNPVSYRFSGNLTGTPKNALNTIENNKGLFITASHPVMVNLRNIASDTFGSSTANIKGNASLVSFGSEGLGLEFRVGYYRISNAGLSSGGAVYSVMATEDGTTVDLPALSITLDRGESYLFMAEIGDLVTADKLVVMNTGSYGDTPQLCGFSGQDGEDGTFDQIAPIQSLGRNYMVVRGEGTAPNPQQANQFFGSEQTTVIAAEPNTALTIQHFNPDGTPFGVPFPITLPSAGESFSFYHGNGQDPFSSSLITSNNPVIVYSGTAVTCETDISTVLPIGGCSGSLNIQTKKFIDYNSSDLPYFGFCIIESATVPVFLNGQNIETTTGNLRIALGTSGFYLITFNNVQFGNPANLIITSAMPLTSSLVQQGAGFSMSAFFSSFGEAAQSPIVAKRNDDCSVTLQAQSGFGQYRWYKDGAIFKNTTVNSLQITESGKYAVQVMKDCGWSGVSVPIEVRVDPCSDLSVIKERTAQNNLDVTFTINVTNLNPHFTEPKAVVTDLLPNGFTYVSSTTTKGSYDNSTGIWNVGTLAPNQTETLTIDCVINGEGNYINTATAEGEYPDTDVKNNKDTATIDVFVADIDAIKDDGKQFYNKGEVLNYTIKVLNRGPQKALNVEVTDKMPHNTTEMTWNGNGKNGTGDLYDIINVLEPNEEVVYQVSLKVPDDHIRVFTNTVEIHSDYIEDPKPVCTRCSDTDIPEFDVPRGISPNGDGDNDYLDLEGFFVSRIVIYNRYGKEVYSKNVYTNEWHGQSNNGDVLPSGTYFYTVYVMDHAYKSGWIELLYERK